MCFKFKSSCIAVTVIGTINTVSSLSLGAGEDCYFFFDGSQWWGLVRLIAVGVYTATLSVAPRAAIPKPSAY